MCVCVCCRPGPCSGKRVDHAQGVKGRMEDARLYELLNARATTGTDKKAVHKRSRALWCAWARQMFRVFKSKAESFNAKTSPAPARTT